MNPLPVPERILLDTNDFLRWLNHEKNIPSAVYFTGEPSGLRLFREECARINEGSKLCRLKPEEKALRDLARMVMDYSTHAGGKGKVHLVQQRYSEGGYLSRYRYIAIRAKDCEEIEEGPAEYGKRKYRKFERQRATKVRA